MYREGTSFKTPDRPIWVLKDRQGAQMHFHSKMEFLYLFSGKMSYTTLEGTHELSAGDIVFFNSNTPHQTTILSENTQNIVIQFLSPEILKGSTKYLARIINTSSMSDYIFRHGSPATEEILSYIKAISVAEQYDDIAHDYIVKANINLMISVLYKEKILVNGIQKLDKNSLTQIMPVLDYINTFYNEEMTLKSLAEMIHLNEQYFSRLFKKVTGTTLTDYINYVRISKAEKILQAGESCSKASEDSGFSSLTYFNRVFKKHKGISPSLYRKISSSDTSYTE